MEAEECEIRGRPGNTYHVNDAWWMRGERRGGGKGGGGGGACPTASTVWCDKPESEFLTAQAEYWQSWVDGRCKVYLRFLYFFLLRLLCSYK